MSRGRPLKVIKEHDHFHAWTGYLLQTGTPDGIVQGAPNLPDWI
jgi:hypothetical protein